MNGRIAAVDVRFGSLQARRSDVCFTPKAEVSLIEWNGNEQQVARQSGASHWGGSRRLIAFPKIQDKASTGSE